MSTVTAKQLQAILDRMGETQVGMARRLEISDRQMRRYCSGQAKIPRVVELAIRALSQPRQ